MAAALHSSTGQPITNRGARRPRHLRRGAVPSPAGGNTPGTRAPKSFRCRGRTRLPPPVMPSTRRAFTRMRECPVPSRAAQCPQPRVVGTEGLARRWLSPRCFTRLPRRGGKRGNKAVSDGPSCRKSPGRRRRRRRRVAAASATRARWIKRCSRPCPRGSGCHGRAVPTPTRRAATARSRAAWGPAGSMRWTRRRAARRGGTSPGSGQRPPAACGSVRTAPDRCRQRRSRPASANDPRAGSGRGRVAPVRIWWRQRGWRATERVVAAREAVGRGRPRRGSTPAGDRTHPAAPSRRQVSLPRSTNNRIPALPPSSPDPVCGSAPG